MKNIHNLSFKNEDILKKANKCGCFYCKKTFHPNQISDWVTEKDNERTAICPDCGVDSIIPELPDLQLTKKLLEDMYEEWFNTTITEKS